MNGNHVLQGHLCIFFMCIGSVTVLFACILLQVQYPPEVDDPSQFLYPELPHDDYGRLLVQIPDAGASTDEESG